MAATTPTGPDPADRDRISEAVDDMEERVVGRRVDPPHSDDVANPGGDGEDEADGSGPIAGPQDEPS
jgi:hypothetical protein